jgi:nucleoside-diphosphate-sugar epimerase
LIEWLSRREIPCRPIGSREVDLVQPSAPAALRGILRPGDAIVFTSALTPERGRDQAAFLKNVVMVHHLCTVLSEAPCAHVVYISSDSVYAPESGDINEQCCCESADMYALSHIVREKLLAQTCLDGSIRLATIRPTAIYGAEDTHNSYGPNRFLRTALREGKIVLFGGGEEERDHVYIDDVVQLIGLCLMRGSAGILSAASGVAVSFHELAQVITTAVGSRIVLQTENRRVPLVHRRFRISALERAFPEFRPTPINAGIRRALDELSDLRSENGSRADPV